jgi:GT2 family glycosyltransferase
MVNYQDYAEKHLAACWDSLRAQRYPRELMRLIIVDNDTTPESQSLIRRMAPEARIIANPSNGGWGGGNNLAIRTALQEGDEYFVLLNMDTVVEPDWLSTLVSAARKRHDLHILQSQIFLNGTGRINSVGNRIHYLGYGYCNGYGQPQTGQDRPVAYRIDYASGASMLVKREVFERIGFFRDEYLVYYDDMEFCWRARLAGFRVGLVEASRCHHKYDFQSRMSKLYYLQRNRLLTVITLQRLRTLLLIAPCLIVSESVLAVYCILRGWGGVVWNTMTYFLRPRTWRWIAARRREVRLLRQRRDADVVKHFAGTIVFAEIRNPLLRYLCNPLLWLYWAVVRRLILW